MKLKKLLASILGIAMVLTAMGISVFAGEIAYVAKIGDVECVDAAAMVNALKSASGDVTVEIYGKVETSGFGLNNSNITKLSFVGKAENAEICVDGVSYIDVRYTYYPIEYTDLTLSHINAGQNIDGFLPQYFSTYNGGNVTYTDCTFPNGVTACGSVAGTTYKFADCTFNNTTSGLYSLWVYGNSTNVVVDGGTFCGVRGIKMYSEGSNDFSDLSVIGATFSNTITEKYAIVLTKAESVTLIDNTFNNTTGTIQIDDDCASLIEGKTVTIDGTEYTVDSENCALKAVGLSGTGTEEDPFLITCIEELKWFRDDVNTYTSDGSNQYKGKYVKLVADIDLYEEDEDGNQISWEPIGLNSTNDHNAFLGTFDGGNHTISNLYIKENHGLLGFFAYVGSYAEGINPTVKNVIFDNVDVSAEVTNHWTANHGDYVGGVIANAGGNSIINNVHVTGDVYVSGCAYVGGIVGHGYPDIDNCSVVAEDGSYVNAGYWCAGGIIGYAGEGGTPITNSSVEGIDIWGAYGAAGAVAGLLQDGNKLSNVSAKNVEVTGADYCSGYIAGNGSASTLTNVSVENVTVGGDIVATDVIATIGNNIYFNLKDALNAAVATKGGNVTVEILDNIDLTGTTWTPVYFNSYSADNANTIVIEGNEKTITGLSDMMFSGVWTGDKLEIRNLTLDEANIKNDAADDTEKKGVGAFVGNVSAVKELVITNCHLTNSHVEGGHWTGGFVGYAAGYSGNDGPVFTEITVEKCSVTRSEITGKGSVGGIVGHATGDAWTTFSVEETAITENTVTSTGSSTNKAGIVMGTIGAAGTAQTTNGTTLTGGVNVAVTESGNVAKSNGIDITTVYGRQGSNTGVLTITGGTYDNNPIEENVSYATPAEGYEIVKNEDNTYGVVLAEPEILENSLHVTYTELGKFDFGDGKGEVSSIRLSLFAGVDTLNYSEAGFDVTVNGTTETFPVKVVYGSVKTMMNGTEETIPASKFGKGVNYIFGETINFPATKDFEDALVRWTPYAVRNNKKILGNTFELSDIFLGSLEVTE